jgi:hypothetical protein
MTVLLRPIMQSLRGYSHGTSQLATYRSCNLELRAVRDRCIVSYGEVAFSRDSRDGTDAGGALPVPLDQSSVVHPVGIWRSESTTDAPRPQVKHTALYHCTECAATRLCNLITPCMNEAKSYMTVLKNGCWGDNAAAVHTLLPRVAPVPGCVQHRTAYRDAFVS